MRLTNDKPPYENKTIKVKCEIGGAVSEPTDVDMTDEENFYMLAMVDVADPNGKQIYDNKVKNLKDDTDRPCPMKFLPDGISDTYMQLMRGLQFLDPVDPDTLIQLARQVKQEELWVRSSLNTHTPLEAAISAGFTEFGSETADEIAKILVARGAPLIRPSYFTSKKGGPTSSPLHMMMSRGQFSRLDSILRFAKDAGRIDGDNEMNIVDLLFEGCYNEPEEGSPIWACVHSGMAVKFLQSPLCRDTLPLLAPDTAIYARAGLAIYVLRAAALGIIARDPEDFARLFQQQTEFFPEDSVAGLPLNRAVEGGAKNALPVSHVKKLISLVTPELVKAYDAAGRTVLISAICAGNVPVVQALLEQFPELVLMPVCPLQFEPKTYQQCEEDLEPAKEKRGELFEKMRQRAIKDARSQKWGAESNDPRTFRSPLANVRPKFPIEFATEIHDPSKIEGMLQAIIPAFNSQNAAFSETYSLEVRRDSVDCALANMASKKMTNTRVIQDVVALWRLNDNVTNDSFKNLPRRAVASGVLRRNKEFLRAIYNLFGNASFDFVLDDPYTYLRPASDLVSKWNSGHSPVVKNKARGLRALVSQAAADVIEEGDDQSCFVKKFEGVRLVTPMLLAVLNDFDLEMAQFLHNELGCSTTGAFLADLFNRGIIKLEAAGKNPEEMENKANLARRCEPYYVVQVLQAARNASNRQSAIDLINFLVTSGGGDGGRSDNNILARQNLDMRNYLMTLFFSSQLATCRPGGYSATGSFLALINITSVTPLPENFFLSEYTISHLAYIGFDEWHLLPVCLLKNYLKHNAKATKYGDEPKRFDENGDEIYSDAEDASNNNNNNGDRSRFIAIGAEPPEGEESGWDAFVYDQSECHDLIKKMYFGIVRIPPYSAINNETRNFCANSGSGVSCAFPDVAVNYDNDTVKGRVSLCKFLIGTFWNAGSLPSERNSVLYLCLNTQHLVCRRARDNIQSCSDSLTLNLLMDAAENKGVVDVPLEQGWYKSILEQLPFTANESQSVIRFLRLFGLFIFRGAAKKSVNLLEICRPLVRFVHDPEFVASLEEWADLHKDKEGTAGSVADLHTALYNYAAKSASSPRRNYDHILNNSEIIQDAKEQIPTQVAATNRERLDEYFASIDVANPFEHYIGNSENWSDFSDDNTFFKIAKLAAVSNTNGDRFWFDNWCVEKLSSFLSSSAFTDNKDEFKMWFALENFLVLIANASRTTQGDSRDNEVNPIFKYLAQEGLKILEEEKQRVRLYNIVCRAVFTTSMLPNTVRLLADSRVSILEAAFAERASELIEQDYKEYQGQYDAASKPPPCLNDEEDCDDDDHDEFSYHELFQFCAPSLALRFGGVEMIERLSIIAKDRPYEYAGSKRNPGRYFTHIVSGFVNSWDQLLASGQPLDMRLVNILFTRASYRVQEKLIRFLVNRGTYINEDVFEGKAVATFMFESLALRGRIESTKAIVEILDLGTRHASDPGGFVRAYSEEVDTAIRNECAMGNRKAIEVAKRCAEAIRETDDFKERGPYQVLDSIYLYDADFLNSNGTGDLFKPVFDMEHIDGENEEEENGFTEWKKMKPSPHDRFLYAALKKSGDNNNEETNNNSNMTPGEVEEFLRYTLDGCIATSTNTLCLEKLPPNNLKNPAQDEENQKLISIAPSVCTNSALQNPVNAARVTIPRIVSIIKNLMSVEEIEQATGVSDFERFERMKSGQVRLDVSSSSSREFWAELEFDNEEHGSFILKINTNAIQSVDSCPEDVRLSDELEKILAFWNAPKLFNP